MTTLNVAEMEVVQDVFASSVRDVLSNFGHSESARYALGFLNELILTHKPYMLITPQHQKAAVKMVFTHDIVRDFVLTLQFNFFARWDSGGENYRRLCDNLAHGLCQPKPAGGANLTPDAILERLPDYEPTLTLLDANPWLVVLLLAQLFVTRQSLEEYARLLPPLPAAQG